MNGNPFYVYPGGNHYGELTGLANTISSVGEQRAKQARFDEVKGAMQAAWDSGDANQFADVMIQYPEAAQTISTLFGFYRDQNGDQVTMPTVQDTYRRIMADPENAETYLTNGINQVKAMGGTPTNMGRDLEFFREDPQKALQAAKMFYAGIDPAGYKAMQSPEKKPLSTVGKLLADREAAAAKYGEKSPQVKFYDRKLARETEKDGNSALTPTQLANNAEIDAARKALAGMSKDDVKHRSTPATATGRDNPDYDPYIEGLVKKATQRKTGDDPEFESTYQNFYSTEQDKPDSEDAAQVQAIIDANPTWDSAKARRYLKYLKDNGKL